LVVKVAVELAKCRMVVDKFHFDHNHTSKYCTLNCSPHAIPELRQANMSICEQSFKRIGKYKGSFRFMNKTRFNFMLLLLTHKHNSFM
jgi:hypothetical protein